MLRLLRVSIVLAGSALAAAGPARAQGGISPEDVQRAIAASVFVKAQRVVYSNEFPTSGSGFFVHPDGYVLTNWHVVADQIQTDLWGKEREVNARVLRLTAVIDSGSPEEREVPARVVARDRDRDLALLKLEWKPEAYVDLGELAEVRLADRVWVVGFPFGDLLAMERSNPGRRDANPEPSISAGMVTSLRRDQGGVLKMIQTDAAVNPGNSGGPMLDAEGRLVGVVFAAISGGQGLGFGIPPNRVREFVDRNAAEITFRPAAVLEPPEPITVTVRPLLMEGASLRGEVRLEGDDIPPQVVRLDAVEGRMEATVPFPGRLPGRKRPASYAATVSLFSREGGPPVQRRFKLDAVPASFVPLKSQRDPAAMMDDRRLLAGDMSISDYARSQEVERQPPPPKTLRDVAGSTPLSRDGEGPLVLDNAAVAEAASPYSVDDERYALLADVELRRLAQELDRIARERGTLEATERALPPPPTPEGEDAATPTPSAVSSRLAELRAREAELRQRLVRALVRQCSDGRYFDASGTSDTFPCTSHSSPGEVR